MNYNDTRIFPYIYNNNINNNIIYNNRPPLYNNNQIKLREIKIKNRNNNKNMIFKKSNSSSNVRICNTDISNLINDKDSLYEKNIQLKNEINLLRKENLKIKSENKKKENEIIKKTNLINKTFQIKEEILNIDDIEERDLKENELYDKVINNNLIYRLKKQYNELKKEMEKKENEIFILKKNIKNSKINEYIVENNALIEEFNKIRNLYNDLINENEKLKIKCQNNKTLEENLSKQHFFVLKYQEDLKNMNEQNILLKTENLKLKTKIKNLNSENKKLNENVNYLNQQLQKLINNKNNGNNKSSNFFEKNSSSNLKNDNSSDSSNFINEKNKMKELTYILIKNLEAKGITKEEVINKIIKETLEKFKQTHIEKENLIELFTNKIQSLINNTNKNDKKKINYLFDNLLSSANNDIHQFINIFMPLLDSIKIYTANENDELSLKIKNLLLNNKKNLETYDKNIISFFSFRKIMNDNNILLPDDCIEFLIYKMKKDCVEDDNYNNYNLFDLNFNSVKKILNLNEDENDSENNTYYNLNQNIGIIEMTKTQYDNFIVEGLNKIKNKFNENNIKSFREILNEENDKINYEKYNIENLNKAFKEKLNFELTNLELYSFYNKYRTEDEKDFINLNELKNDLFDNKIQIDNNNISIENINNTLKITNNNDNTINKIENKNNENNENNINDNKINKEEDNNIITAEYNNNLIDDKLLEMSSNEDSELKISDDLGNKKYSLKNNRTILDGKKKLISQILEDNNITEELSNHN